MAKLLSGFWKPQRLRALIWLLAAAAALIFDAVMISRGALEADLLALLPAQKEQAALGKVAAMQREGRAILSVLTGTPKGSAAEASSAGRAVISWARDAELHNVTASPDAGSLRQALKSGIHASESDLKNFESNSPEELSSRLMRVAAGLDSGFVLTFSEDPFGLSQRWLRERLSATPWRIDESGALSMTENGVHWRLSRFEVPKDLYPMGQGRLLAAVSDLKARVHDCAPSAQIFASGVPLFSDAASLEAKKEISLMGSVSLLLVLLLARFWFGSFRSVGLIVLVTAGSMAAGLAAVFAVMGKVHAVTLIFGTTLIGITVDYSAHYFCRIFGLEDAERRAALKGLLPGLSLALATTCLAFALMALAPLPGLRQMALFCTAGLFASFAGVCLFLPAAAGRAEEPKRLTTWLGAMLRRWPSFERIFAGRKYCALFCCSAAAAAIAAGLCRMPPGGDVRELTSFDEALLQESGRVAAISRAPSVSQMAVFSAPTLDMLLEREEAFSRLLTASDKSVVPQLLSDWVSSSKRCARIAAAERRAVKLTETFAKGVFGAGLQPIPCARDAEAFFATPVGRLLKGTVAQESGFAAQTVLFAGLTAANAEAVKKTAEQIPGVLWVNTLETYSALLSSYRNSIMLFLSAAAAAAFAVLAFFLRKKAWRALLPTVLGVLAALSLMGWSGQSVSIFTVLGAGLVVGLGLDYGIFVTLSPNSRKTLAAVTFSFLTTLISFCLLCFSGTPALQTFGLMVTSGSIFIWFLTPFFRSEAGR